MILSIVDFITYITCSIFPWLLTIKAANGSKQDASEQWQHIRFLLHYWVYFVLFNGIIRLIALDVLASNQLIQVSIKFLTLAVELWLFYGKGCLILSDFYLTRLFGRVEQSDESHFNRLEVAVFDPLAHLFFINSQVAKFVLNTLLNFSGSDNIFHEIFASFLDFNSQLSTEVNHGNVRSPFFLESSLNYFCGYDNATLYHLYKLTNKSLSFAKKPTKKILVRKSRIYDLPSNAYSPEDVIPIHNKPKSTKSFNSEHSINEDAALNGFIESGFMRIPSPPVEFAHESHHTHKQSFPEVPVDSHRTVESRSVSPRQISNPKVRARSSSKPEKNELPMMMHPSQFKQHQTVKSKQLDHEARKKALSETLGVSGEQSTMLLSVLGLPNSRNRSSST